MYIKNKLIFFTRDSCYTLILLAIVCLAYFQNFFFHFYYDGYYLISTMHTHASDQLGYWIDIFTQTNHGTQYRPLSFFAFFNIFPRIVGKTPFPFHVLGIILIFSSSYYFFNYFKRESKKERVSLLLTLIFLFHPVHHNLSEVSMIVKYYFPLFVLCWSFFYIVFPQALSNRRIIFYVLLILASILCQEGAVTFPFIVFALRWIKHRTYSRGLFFSFLPVAVYFFFRVFVFGLPRAGFMKISPSFVLESMPHFFNYTLFPFIELSFHDPTTWVDYIGLIFFLFLSLYYLMRKKPHFIVFFTLSILMIGPFALLKNHFVPDRLVWGAIWLPVFLFYFPKKALGPKIYTLVLLFILALTAQRSFYDFEQKYSYYKRYQKRSDLWFNQFKDIVSRTPEPFAINYKVKKVDGWEQYKSLPFMLAYRFPNKSFKLKIFDEESRSINLFVRRGAVYHKIYPLPPSLYQDMFLRPVNWDYQPTHVVYLEDTKNVYLHLDP